MSSTITLRRFVASFGLNIDNRSFARVDDKINKTRNSFLRLGVAAGVPLGLAVKSALDLENALGRTMTMIKGNTNEFGNLQKEMMESALSMSETLGFSATQVADAFYQTLSTGAFASTKRFDDLSKSSLKFAKISGLSASQAVEGLNDSLRAFNREGLTFEQVADKILVGSRMAATSIPQLVKSFKVAGNVSATLNRNIEETTAVLLTMAQRGIKASEAGIGYRQVMLRLARDTGPAGKALHSMGLSAFDAYGKMKPLTKLFQEIKDRTASMTEKQRHGILIQIAGARAFQKFSAVLDSDMVVLQEFIDKLQQSDGAMELAFKKRMEEANQRLLLFWVSIKNLSSQIGSYLLPDLGRVADKFKNVTIGMRMWVKEHPKLTRAIGILLAMLVGGSGLMIALTTVAVTLKGIALLGSIAFAPWVVALGAVAGGILTILGGLEDLAAFLKGDKASLIGRFFGQEITPPESRVLPEGYVFKTSEKQKMTKVEQEYAALRKAIFVPDPGTKLSESDVKLFAPYWKLMEEQRAGLEDTYLNVYKQMTPSVLSQIFGTRLSGKSTQELQKNAMSAAVGIQYGFRSLAEAGYTNAARINANAGFDVSRTLIELTAGNIPAFKQGDMYINMTLKDSEAAAEATAYLKKVQREDYIILQAYKKFNENNRLGLLLDQSETQNRINKSYKKKNK